jgi:hypothetical protein
MTKSEGVFTPSVPEVSSVVTHPIADNQAQRQLLRLVISSLDRCVDRAKRLETWRSLGDKAQQAVSADVKGLIWNTY